jgi:hypothetical protein
LTIQMPPPTLVPTEFPKTMRLPSADHPGWNARIGRCGVLVVTWRLPVPSGLTTKRSESV